MDRDTGNGFGQNGAHGRHGMKKSFAVSMHSNELIATSRSCNPLSEVCVYHDGGRSEGSRKTAKI